MNNPTVAKSLLKSYGITDLLNSNVTEVIINRAGEIITEDGDGFHYHDANFSYQDLINLANVLCTLNDKNISAKEPTQSIRLPDGERGNIVIPPACEPNTVVFAFRKP
ncbi:MAG: secretion system protein E, partial [Neisseriaceae bacterium]|nr:secretion system protein E [Neisseriaceae bacterium]